MNRHDAMERLRTMGNEKLRESNRRHGWTFRQRNTPPRPKPGGVLNLGT